MLFFQYANLGLRFILELCALASLGYWGFHISDKFHFNVLMGLGAPLAAAVFWGTFLSPKASIPLPGVWALLLEATVFGLAVAALYASGHPKLALLFVFVLVINRLLMWIWNQ